MKSKVKRTLYGILALLAGLLLYGVAIEPHLILAVDRQTVLLPHLPPSWDGQRVAVMGDLQVGMWLGNSDMAQRAVQQIVAARPAAVVLLGDFVDQPTGNLRDELHTLTQILRPLTAARLPTYAVLGLYVVGIGEQLAHDDRATAALDGVPHVAARIVILHDPVSFPQLPSASAPLGVAGHTHCGQVRIPFTAPWSWLWLVAGHPVPAEGWIAHYGQPGNHLYVNCGIGMSVVPFAPQRSAADHALHAAPGALDPELVHPPRGAQRHDANTRTRGAGHRPWSWPTTVRSHSVAASSTAAQR